MRKSEAEKSGACPQERLVLHQVRPRGWQLDHERRRLLTEHPSVNRDTTGGQKMPKTGPAKSALVASLLTLAPIGAQARETISCVFPFWFGFAPVMVAEKPGCFGEEGLSVTWTFDDGRANVRPAPERGTIDSTIHTIAQSMAVPRPADLTDTIIATIDISVGARTIPLFLTCASACGPSSGAKTCAPNSG